MRGKAQLTIRDQPSDRITPAYAGKSAGKKHRTSWSGDHPRLCGEKVVVQSAEHFDQGITPAYAGKRSGATEKQIAHKDHPRLCGEKFFRRRQKFARLGSPPPMRGKGKHTLDSI